jgi:hypothetical protein
MSLNPMQDPGNPANPNSLAWQQANAANKHSPNTTGDLVLMGIIIGIFGVIIAINLLMQ